MDETIEQTEAQKNEEVESNTQDDNVVELSKEEILELKKKAEVSSQNFERAKKAERELEELKKGSKKEETVLNVTAKDMLALNEAKVSSEDYDEVVRVAKILEKPISEALKDGVMKGILADRAEQRATAKATQTRSPRSVSKESSANLIEKANKEGIANWNPEDIDKLAEARMEARLKK